MDSDGGCGCIGCLLAAGVLAFVGFVFLVFAVGVSLHDFDLGLSEDSDESGDQPGYQAPLTHNDILELLDDSGLRREEVDSRSCDLGSAVLWLSWSGRVSVTEYEIWAADRPDKRSSVHIVVARQGAPRDRQGRENGERILARYFGLGEDAPRGEAILRATGECGPEGPHVYYVVGNAAVMLEAADDPAGLHSQVREALAGAE